MYTKFNLRVHKQNINTASAVLQFLLNHTSKKDFKIEIFVTNLNTYFHKEADFYIEDNNSVVINLFLAVSHVVNVQHVIKYTVCIWIITWLIRLPSLCLSLLLISAGYLETLIKPLLYRPQTDRTIEQVSMFSKRQY